MRYMAIFVFLMTLGTLSGVSAATAKKICPGGNGTELTFPKGANYRVLKFDPLTRTYEIQSEKYPGEETLHVTLAALALSTSKIKGKLASLRSDPNEIITTVFTSDLAKIPSLTLEEVRARYNCEEKN